MSKKKNKEQEELRQSAQAAGQAEKKADIESKEETPAVDKEAKEIEEKLAKLLKENEELKATEGTNQATEMNKGMSSL